MAAGSPVRGPDTSFWKRDAEVARCEACRAPFTFFSRRHHCRHCGGIYCGRCAGGRRRLPPAMGYAAAQRVCDECRDQIDRGAPAPAVAAEAQRREPVVRQRKVCVLGKQMVGKSAICVQYVEDRFSPYYHPTINHTYQRKVRFRGDQYLLSILDTAGQDEVSIFQPQYSIGTHAYIVLFSLTDYHSFEMAPLIYDKIQDCNILEGVVLVLVGNKCDTPAAERQVSEHEAQELAASWGCAYLECSAKSRDGIDEVFTTVLDRVCQRDEPGAP